MYLNAYQQYIDTLIEEYGSLLCRQLLVAVNHEFKTSIPSVFGYVSQMCRYGDYEIVTYGTDHILFRKGEEPDYDMIRAFDVMLSFYPQVIWHRKSRAPIALRFMISTLKHDKEIFVIPVQQGTERTVSEYVNDKFDNEKCEVVIFLLEVQEQMQRVRVSCNFRFALITKDGVVFYKKE